MSLHVQITSSLKDAMKAKDAVRVRVIKNIKSAVINELVASNQTPQDTLDDEKVLQIIKRLAKQREEAIAQYKNADRTEQAAAEEAELNILQEYLPQTMSVAEILPVAQKKQTELGITDKSQSGRLVGAVMQELVGKAEGSDVKQAVNSLFTE